MGRLMESLFVKASFVLACFVIFTSTAKAQNSSSFTVMALTNVWKYDVSGTDLGTAWRQIGFDDSAWPSGPGVLAFEDNNALTRSLTNTILPLRNGAGSFITNFYFRAHFNLTNDPYALALMSSNLIDDGAVFYLNGTEYTRIRVGNGPVTANTFAQAPPAEGVFSNVVIPANLLAQGDNVLAVEVHQASATSADVVFGMAILATVFPPAPPEITLQPTGSSIFIGQAAAFVAAATGPGTLGYQWFQNGAPIANATNNTLNIAKVEGIQAGDYFLVVTNVYGAATSSVASLTVYGGEAILRPLEFASTWRYNGSGSNLGTAWRSPAYNDGSWPLGTGVFGKSPFALPEPINTSFPLTNSSGSGIITYYFRTHFDVPAGRTDLLLIASNLVDDGAVFYLNGFEAARLRLSGTVTASTLASGAPQSGTAYETLSLPLTNLAEGDNVLAVEVHQSSATSPDMVFGMNLRGYAPNTAPLTIVNQPNGQTANEGKSVSFFADVFGGQPVFYQWFQDGTPILDATNATLSLPTVRGANVGGYSFVASNWINSVTSTVANVSIIPDQTPPNVVAAFATNDFNNIMVIFSEPISPLTATNMAFYAIAPSAILINAQLAGPDRVLLFTSGRDVQFDYTLTVANIRDRADSANIMPTQTIPIGRDTRVISTGLQQIQTVFIILMENQDWASIKGSTNCSYINSLLPQASYCEHYYAHDRQHPSAPNYIWLEAGDNFGHTDDAGPTVDRVRTTNHLSTMLYNAGIEWRGYMESMPAGVTGTNDALPYLARHNPFAFFDDVTTNYAYCTNHVRPYSRFAGDLAANRIGRYNFISPNITNDMHSLASGSTSLAQQGDFWLSHELPLILNSAAFSNNGAVFITWDESDISTTNAIGMIVLSPLAKGGGYASTVYHDHSSTLCTMQAIFNVRPYLADSANANTLSELFHELTLTTIPKEAGLSLVLNHVLPGKTNYVQASSDLIHWSSISTNIASGPTVGVDFETRSLSQLFFRVVQAP